MDESRIEPMIFFGPGLCNECGGQLMVADMETTFMVLNRYGSPMTEETMVHCEAVCNHCGKRIPMMRNGLNYIPDNDYNRFMREYNNRLHTLQVEARMEELKPTEDNPFCINIERRD